MSTVFGIPTVKRNVQSYLVSPVFCFDRQRNVEIANCNFEYVIYNHAFDFQETTLASLFINMVEGEKNDSLVIVLVAETNLPDVAIISSLVGQKFSEVDHGFKFNHIAIISSIVGEKFSEVSPRFPV